MVRGGGCFAYGTIKELHIGENVKVIPDALFADASILTNSLKLNVEEIGQYAFYGSESESSIRTLEIGENVTHIGRGAFGAVTCDEVDIYAVNTGNELVIYAGEMPTCGRVKIHRNADSYDYFTQNTDEGNITLLCKDFETTYGDEFFDEKTSKFVTPVTDTCPVCGYEAKREEYVDGYTVIFYDADGNELSRQGVKHGEAAKTPEAPKKESTPQYSYTFKGWDGDTDNITGNASFHPVYETKTRAYTVTFMNGDQMVDKQTVEYGQAATPPKEPVKEADDKYTYTFAGWDGDYDFITEDTVIYALFERHEIPETDDKGDEGEPEQENPESGGQGSGTAPGQDSDSNQETGSGNELGNPDAGTSEDSGGQTEESDSSTAGHIFRVAMPAPSISDWIFNDTASAAEEEPEEISEKYEESDIVENELDIADMADTDDADDTDDRQDLTVPDTGAYRRDNNWPTWLMPLLGMIAAGAFLICLYLILRNRKAYGIILNVYGSPECGAQITMIGKDMPESETNKNGCLRIDGLKKDDYRLKVTQKKGYRMLSVDIVMENRDKEETLTILES